MVKTKVVPINQIISEVTSNIAKSIDNMEEISVQMNIGKLAGMSFFSNIGPKFNMKMETSRTE